MLGPITPSSNYHSKVKFKRGGTEKNIIMINIDQYKRHERELKIKRKLEANTKESYIKKIKCRDYFKKLIDHTVFQIIMTLVTIYALLGDDLRVIYVPKSFDDYFTDATLLAMILFFIELILTAYAQDGYLWTFFFWLDLISTVTLITDIDIIWLNLLGQDQS